LRGEVREGKKRKKKKRRDSSLACLDSQLPSSAKLHPVGLCVIRKKERGKKKEKEEKS